MTSLSAWSPQRYTSRKTQSGGSVASAWQCLWACAWRGWTVTRPSLTTQPWLPWALTWHTRFDGFIYIFSTWKFLIRNHSAFQPLAENSPSTLKKKRKNPVNFWKDHLKAFYNGLLLPSTFCRTLLRRPLVVHRLFLTHSLFLTRRTALPLAVIWRQIFSSCFW